MNAVNLEDLLVEILSTFIESTSKEIKINSDNDKNKINIKRSPEIIYGLRNVIGNEVKFSNNKIQVEIASNIERINIIIHDDGPGFPEDIVNVIGEPYIRSKETSPKSGLGLGTFLGKTLLERQGAKLSFKNNNKYGGASVSIEWNVKDLSSSL